MSEQKFHASVFAVFEDKEERNTWLKEHGVDQNIINGGPVYSHSPDNEGKFRDECRELRWLLSQMRDLIKDHPDFQKQKFDQLGVAVNNALKEQPQP